MVRHLPSSSESETYSDLDLATTSEQSSRTLRTRNNRNTKKVETKKIKFISEPESSDLSDFQEEKTRDTRSKKKRKLSPKSSSEDTEDVSEDQSQENENSDSEEKKPNKKEKYKRKIVKNKKKKRKSRNEKHVGRRSIKKILTEDALNEETKNAELEEEERRKRLKERGSEKLVEVSLDDSIPLIEPISVTKRLVLQKEPLVEVHPEITVHLKPHQVEGIQFIWDNLVENTTRAKQENGGGCILAHCMGLGKTLQTITSIHTIFHCKELSITTALVVAPLNTLLNWVDEFHKWCPDNKTIRVYNLSENSLRRARLNMLKEWKRLGGVLIMGYDMFRLLATGVGIKYKPWKVAFQQLLLDPGPDLVICDEGHKLKNSEANISIVMNKIKTKRRLVLTGTPLQNNLIEYQCMVNFVKPNLLGSLKEFRNRFVNPILNGQHSDSTVYDVKLMKKRCHILHEMLHGFVQRKDYTALAKYLCDKKEFILKVRLSDEQIDLYRHFLNTKTNRGENPNAVERGSRDTGLFADYQNLLRIWTHPRILQLHTIREVKRANLKYEDSSDEAMSTDHEYSPTKPKPENGINLIQNKPETSMQETLNNSVTLIESSDEEKGKSDTKLSPGRKRSRRIQMSSSEEEEEGQSNDATTSEEEEAAISSPDEEEEDQSSSVEEEEELEVVKKAKSRSNRYRTRIKEDKEEEEIIPYEDEFTDEWFSSIIPPDHRAFDSVESGGKVAVLFEILRLAKERDDKVLVFSQSLLSLDLIEEMLKLSTIKAESEESAGKINHNFEKWYKNVDYYRMDGSSGGKSRQRSINDFNNEEDRRGRLFLISTKAGSLGVNLVAANRVVIFDASWNPSHDIQSIFRVYRFGQTKCCYIYRLVAQGTMEEKIYDRQVTKQSLAFRVVDEQQINRHFTASDLQELYQFTPSKIPTEDEEKSKHILPDDDLLADILGETSSIGKYISSYHKHDSLLDHQEAEELTEEERKAAWDEYENEKKGIRKQQMVYVPVANNSQFNVLPQGAFGAGMIGANPFIGAVPVPPVLLPRIKEEQQQMELQKVLRSPAGAEFLSTLSKLPSEQQELAKSIFTLMIKTNHKLIEHRAKYNLLQPLDKERTIGGLKSMSIYKNLTDQAFDLVFFNLQIKQKQMQNNLKKEIKKHEMEFNWLQSKYQTLLDSCRESSLSKDQASTSASTQEQTSSETQEQKSNADLAQASEFARNSFAEMAKEKPTTEKEKNNLPEPVPKKFQLKKLSVVLKPSDHVTSTSHDIVVSNDNVIMIDSD